MVDIKDATLKQLVTERPDLVQAIKNGEDKGTAIGIIVKDIHERIATWTEERRDIDGILVSKRVDEYTYYETEEVDIVTQEIYDESNKLIDKKKIKHYLDGNQPDVEIVTIQKVFK